MENLSTSLPISKKILLIILTGFVLTGIGAIYLKSGASMGTTKVEVLEDSVASQNTSEITVEVSGSIENPGVYKLASGSRIEDLLVSAGGFSKDADRNYLDKYLNRASKLTDGQKLYIPSLGEQTLGVSAKGGTPDQTISSAFGGQNGTSVNINTATLSELDSLPEIGQVYGQSIIDHRPYSNTQELVSKGAIKQNVFEKIKNQVTTY